ncbi:olfactory receptor 10C1-like [Pseudophryne corroboree]|uniref:olfactory receptor 10C1-like n=1 Tax=Pseudophryne corroboree TaxID=495146 RepID=UPI00308219E4
MEELNKTMVKEFILVGFSDLHHYQILFLIAILLMYITSVAGNFAVIILVKTGLSLHCPMYYFICVFAALEISFVSVTVPRLLANMIVSNKKISFVGCFVQLYIFSVLGITECFLLAVMAFDRDLAINHPLRYSSVMNHLCVFLLVVTPFIISCIITLFPTIFTADLKFCGPNEINHFFCELTSVQKLACSNTFISKILTSVATTFASLIPFILIIGFYIHIIITITKIKSVEGKHKAFSTCSSHIIVACLFYSTVIIVYINPQGSQYDKFLTLMYTVIVPMLNPFIYTLRNNDVKKVFLTTMLNKFKYC